MIKKLAINPKIKIFAALSVTILTLASSFSATIAWFNAAYSTKFSSGDFEIAVAGSCGLADVKLIKFDYATTTIGTVTSVDYLSPENGDVNMYSYSYENHSFGVQNGLSWEHVDAMNIYDPVDRVVRQTSLKDLNCNAIYKVTFEASNLTTTYMELTSTLFSIADLGDDILLSDCVDIDIFYSDDLDDDNPSFFQDDDIGTADINEYDDILYYPSYKFSEDNKFYKWNGSTWQSSVAEPTGEGVNSMGTINYYSLLPESPSVGDYYQVLKTPIALSALEDTYYKISYLSSLIDANGHSHFYGNPKSNTISIVHNEQIIFTEGVPITFYINVNYAPSEADKYMNLISLANVRARYDYTFKFEFLEAPRP